MTDREKLLKILNAPIHPHKNVDPLEAVADYLLDNGVTFTENIIRCGKCKSWDPDTGYCIFWHGVRPAGHYCGEGVKK